MNRSEKKALKTEKFLENLLRTNSAFLKQWRVLSRKVDGRVKPQYSSLFMFTKVIVLFFFQTKSINAAVEDDVIHKRMDQPTQRAYAYYLELTGVIVLNQILWAQFHLALRLKQLDSLRGLGNRFTLAFDGISLTYSKKRHCDKCLETTKDGVTSYHHSMLAASIVDKVNKVSLVIAVIPIENEKGMIGKQACELKATTAMLIHLRKMNAYLRYNITVDGLYLSAEFIDQAVKLGHSVTMPLAKENMIIHKVLDVRFNNGRPSVVSETVTEKTTVAYDAENIAEYWDALHKLNPDIKIYGLKRTITNKTDANVAPRECPIITTIEPTAKNANALSDIQREKWQEENKTFNVLKNHHFLKHIFNHKAQTQVFMFASIAVNMRTLFLLRHPPQRYVRKPLSLESVIAAILNVCKMNPMNIFRGVIDVYHMID